MVTEAEAQEVPSQKTVSEDLLLLLVRQVQEIQLGVQTEIVIMADTIAHTMKIASLILILYMTSGESPHTGDTQIGIIAKGEALLAPKTHILILYHHRMGVTYIEVKDTIGITIVGLALTD